MVYATRSRVLAHRRSAAGGTVSTARTLGEEKETPRKRRSSTHLASVIITKDKAVASPTSTTRSKKAAATTTTTSSGRKPVAAVRGSKAIKAITVETSAGRHRIVLDGKDHHLIESDGRDHHHLRFKDYSDSENGGARRHDAEEKQKEMPDTFEPAIQSNRESRRESLSGGHSVSHRANTACIQLSKSGDDRLNHSLSRDENAQAQSKTLLKDAMSVHRTHLHFPDNDGALGGPGGYSHDHTDRDYMSGELTKEDDCVPKTLKRTRTMLETFEEGREFVGRQWHFEGEGKECGHEGRAHKQKHKHYHRTEAHDHHHHHQGGESEAIDGTYHYNTRSRGPVEDQAMSDEGRDEYIQPFDHTKSRSSAPSIPAGGWGLHATFDRLASFFGTRSSSKGDKDEADDGEEVGDAETTHLTEDLQNSNQHIRWFENVSDAESSEPNKTKKPSTSLPLLRPALKNNLKKRVLDRHVSYQEDVEEIGNGDENDTEESDTETDLSSQDEASGSRWPLARIGSALRHLRSVAPRPTNSMTTKAEDNGDPTATTETTHTSSSAPLHLIDSVVLAGKDNQGSEVHTYRGSKSPETASEATATSSNKVNNNGNKKPSSRPRTRDESASRLLAQKSQIDRTKARDAILHLDRDVALLQKMLQEKEDTLRAAEAARSQDQQQVTICTETLTREIHELEITIHDLRSQVAQRDQDLEMARSRLAEEKKKSQDQLKVLEQEIVTLNQTNFAKLKDKEAAEEDAMRAKKQLDETNHERARLLTELRELKNEQAVKESQLTAARASLQGLERKVVDETRRTEDLRTELGHAEGELNELRQQLQQALDQVKDLEAAEARVEQATQQLKAAKEEIKNREGYMRALEKTNASMCQKSDEADKLAVEVERLKERLEMHEKELDEARELIDELAGSRDRANLLANQIAALEDQLTRQTVELEAARERLTELEHAHDRAEELAARVIDLEDQVNVEEKHLTYLEDNMLEHENCAADAKQLADRIIELEEQVDEHKREIHRLQDIEKDAEKKDQHITQLQTEMQEMVEELQDKSKALKNLQIKYGRETAKLESIVNQLKTETEALKQQLAHKVEQFEKVNKVKDQLGRVQEEMKELSDTIGRLHHEINQKETRIEKLEETLARLHQDNNKKQEQLDQEWTKNRELRDQIKLLERETNHAKSEQIKAINDLAKASSSASQLVVEVVSLNDRIAQKEADLAKAEKRSAQLEQKEQQIQNLLSQIQDVEREAADNLMRAHVAEKEANELEERASRVHGLEKEIQELNKQLEELQETLDSKEVELAAMKKITTQHEAAKCQVDELKAQVKQIKDQLKTAQSQSKQDVKTKDAQIQALKNEIQAWIEHEAGWIQRTMDLTGEIEIASKAAREKDKQLSATKSQLHDQEAQASRLALERKRQSCEAEDRLRYKLRKIEQEKKDLTIQSDLLENENHRLAHSLELQRDREAHELELQEYIRELLLWKENSIVQTEEWELTVTNLEKDKTQLAKELASQEKLVKQLEGEAGEWNEWRQRALEQAERLKAMVLKLEKELQRLHDTLAEHDAKDATLHTIMDEYKAQIARLEGAQASMHKQLRERDATIQEFETRLQQEIRSYELRLADACGESQARDQEVTRLQALLVKKEKLFSGLIERIGREKALIASLQMSLDKQKISLKEKADRFNDLSRKYEAALQVQSTQDRQIYRLEKQLAETTARDSDKLIEQQAQIHKLEKQLGKSQAHVANLEIELHKAATNYHDTVIVLEEARARLAGMVPVADAKHDACAARVSAGEREVERLTREVENLEDRIIVFGREAQVKAQTWLKTEADYKDRIERLLRSQHDLESRVLDTQKNVERERLQRDQEHRRLAAENANNGDLIQQLRRNSAQWEKEYSEIETRMRHEMSSTKDLAAKLAALRKLMMRDNQAGLRALDELEKELKMQASKVEQTIAVTRSRLDSGAFMDANAIAQVQQQLGQSQALSAH